MNKKSFMKEKISLNFPEQVKIETDLQLKENHFSIHPFSPQHDVVSSLSII